MKPGFFPKPQFPLLQNEHDTTYLVALTYWHDAEEYLEQILTH